jgi:hypothetical protein
MSRSSWDRHERPIWSSNAYPPVIHQRPGNAVKMATAALRSSGSQGLRPSDAMMEERKSPPFPDALDLVRGRVQSEQTDVG